MGELVIRPYQVGDASYVCYLQMELYHRVYGFRSVFEYYLLLKMAEFMNDPAGSELWVAVIGEQVVGSIAMVKTGEEQAQLRWFVTHEAHQRRGIGKRLMETALAFCRSMGYRHVFLWTASNLAAARSLYSRYGFTKTEEKPNTTWSDQELMEERWDLTL